MARATWILFCASLGCATACGSGNQPRNQVEGPDASATGTTPTTASALPPRIPDAPEVAKEVLETEKAAVDESGIRAAFVEDGLELEIPVDKLSAGPLDGEVEIALLDAAGATPIELLRGSVDFEQTDDSAVHRVLLRDVPTEWARAQTAPIVIAWQVLVSGEQELTGLRSLYTALGPLEAQLRGPTELSEGEGAPLRVIVRQRQTSEAIEGARVTATLTVADTGETLELFEGETNSFGEFTDEIVFPAGASSGQVRVDVDHELGQVWTTAAMQVTGEERLHLSSDKTIYKPGQTIELRLLALSGPDRTPVTDTDAVFEAYDGEGLKVYKRTVQTDSFGAASVSVPTDTRVNEGSWRFQATVAGVAQALGIPVRQYILPKLGVDVTTDVPYALPGETVHARVDARYLFGEPVVAASVTVLASAPGFASSFQGSTDDDGVFEFDVAAPATIPSLSDMSFVATVVDSANQQQSGAGQLRLSPSAVLVEAMTEQSPVIDGVRNRLIALVSDPLGRPLAAEVAVTGLTDEAASMSAGASGIAQLSFTPQETTSPVTLVATDGAGREGTGSLVLSPVPRPELVLRADRALYAPGDEALLNVIGPRDAARVYVDLFRGVAAVASVVVPLENGRGELLVPITTDMGGMLLADAFVPTAAGQVLEASTRLLVESDQRLRVSLTPSGDSFSPGAEAGLEVRVTDLAGNPQVAAVGLTVVNEAAFALGGEPGANLERTFGIDSPLLPTSISVLGQTSLELFNLPPTAERQLLARALFARSAAQAQAPMLPHFDYSSELTELPQVLAAMQTKTSLDGNALVNALRSAFNGTTFEAELWFETVESQAKRLRDPFGQRYQVNVDPTLQQLTLGCSGPDETRRTEDDVTVVISAYLPSPPVIATPTSGVTPGGGVDGTAFTNPAAPPMAAGLPAGPAAFAPTDEASGEVPAPDNPGRAAPAGVAVRTDFRETVYANPSVVTTEDGSATLTFPLAHSISTWRASAEGSTLDGRVGTARTSFRTFQSFFVDFDVPPNLTRGDEVELPVVVYNYLPEPTDVSITFEAGAWLELQSSATADLALEPSEVRAVRFRVRVLEAGNHSVTLHAAAGDVSDAVIRDVAVRPDGQPEDETASGTVDQEGITHALSVPDGAIAGGTSLTLTLTPGFAADASKSVEGMLNEPNGCFEQTTASAWPNTMVAHYLDQAGELTGDKREEVLAMITRGYQRLLTFESPTGGYNWWGDTEPGNRILSAIMLWHLKDLESLIEIDTAVRDRTLNWLLTQQQPDGSFQSGDALHAGNQVLGTSEARTTAFIAWALGHTGWADEAVARSSDWLRSNLPGDDFYASALVANALAVAAPTDATTLDVLGALDELKSTSDDGVAWQSDTPSWTGASGGTLSIETTGLVAYGMMKANSFLGSADGAVRYILANKDSAGTWYSTQATMNALRALSAALKPDTSDASGTLSVFVNGELAQEIEITPEQSDVYRSIDLSAFATTGENQVDLSYDGTGELNYQLTRRAYLPTLPAPEGPLSLEVSYSTTECSIGEMVWVTAMATNQETGGQRDQVLVRVGRAPGFEPVSEDLAALVASGLVSRYEVQPNDVTLYLMGLLAGETRALPFRMTPTLAVDAVAPTSSIYAYYEPNLAEKLAPERFVVTAQ